MQNHQNMQVLENDVVQWKQDIINYFQNKEKSSTQSCDILFKQITIFTQKINNALKKIQTNQQINTIKLPVRMLLVLWQIYNYVMVSLEESKLSEFFKIVDENQKILLKLIEQTSQFKLQQLVKKQQKFHGSQFKCMLIFVFNLYKKQYQKPQLLFNTVKQLLKFQILHQNEQKQFLTQQEDQWNIYIMNLIFNSNYSYRELFQYLQKSEQAEKLIKKYLQLISHSLAQAITRRNTTQLIETYQCKIQDIKQMYSNQNNHIQIKIKSKNLQYLLQNLKNQISHFCKSVSDSITGKTTSHSNGTLLVLIDIIGQIIFLGGYNSSLQNFVQQYILSDILLMLQLCFNLYNTHRKTKSNIKLQTQAENNIAKNMANILNLPQQSIDLQLAPKLPNSILPLILKILSNLVHINRSAQQYFEKEQKYFYIVLNLTHNIPQQMTMREWSIVFIRHVSECSIKLREIIANSKIDINVDKKKIEEVSPFLDTVQM